MNNIENGFTPEINRLLLEWKANIEKNARIHRKKALKYIFINNIFMIVAAILSGLSTSGGLATIAECEKTVFFPLCVINIVISAVATVITSIISVLQFVNKSSENKNAFDRYIALARNIDTIIISKNDPKETTNILNGIRSVFDDIANSSPLIPDSEPSLRYAIFDRTTRKNSVPDVGTTRDPSLENTLPATKEELEQVNKNASVTCIDINLEENKKPLSKPDPMLKYQLERFMSFT